MLKNELDNLKEKIWVTRKNIFIDRSACTWLIQRFVDNTAVFKSIDPGEYSPKTGRN
ncbi:MAG: chromate resistance protein [Desulfobacula sp.]|nr:chromate resistance protein [Desulfobacula sp.]